MKSVSLFIFLFSFLCAGCGEELTPQTQSTTTFTIETPAVTRAEVTGLSRYIVEAYEGNDLTATPVRVESSTGSLTIALKKETDYTFLFWADKGGYWNTADLKAVAVTTDKKTDAGQAAYCLCVSFNSKDFEANKAVTLKNATAQVNFVETAGLAAANNTLKVTYATGAALNVGTGKVTEVAGEVVHTYTAIAQADPNATLAADYVLAPLNEKSVVNLTVQFNDEAEKAIGNVPFQQSYRTNIKGEYSNLYNSVFTISNEVGDYEDGGEVETDPLPPFTVTNTVKGGLQAAIAAAGLTASPKIIILGPVDDVDMRYVGSLTTLNELDLSGATLWGKADKNAAETENTLTHHAFFRGYDESNTTLTAVTLPNSLEIIGSYAFWMCEALTSIAIPASVTSIIMFAFFECTKLATITFAGTSQLKIIEYSAFANCVALTSIAIPASVTSIEADAFRYCSLLKSITLHSTTMIPYTLLLADNPALTDIYVPSTLVDTYKAAEGWKDFAAEIIKPIS